MFGSRVRLCAASCVIFATAAAAFAAPTAVRESPRSIPVAYQVDVVVVGGSTGAVSAAVSAASHGARVFLAAPRPYLGEDMCGSMRLWLAPGEEPDTPLAQSVFTDRGDDARVPADALKLTYKADRPAAKRHPDNSQHPKLTSGILGPPDTAPLQFDGEEVVVTSDLGTLRSVGEARLFLFYREGEDFTPGSVTIAISADKEDWKTIGTFKPGEPDPDQLASVAATIGAKARYVRYDVKAAPGAKRILLGQIVILPDRSEPALAATQPSYAGPVRPMHVKKTLDDALLAAGVKYLYGCYATELLRDGKGQPCGIVMADRAGRQAVLAKVIIDATDRATVARLAGATVTPFPAGEQTFTCTVVGGDNKNEKGITSKIMARGFGEHRHRAGTDDDSGFDLVQYTMPIQMADGSWQSFAQAEQIGRDRSWGDQGEINTDELFLVPPDPVKCQASVAGAWSGAAALDLHVTQPAGVERLYVLGGCADVSRDAAEKLLRPCALMELGERIGAAAAADAATLASPRTGDARVAPVPGEPAAALEGGDVRELLDNVRPSPAASPTIASPERTLPILATYDVVVVGGGTAGAPAAIAAARTGAKTLCIEYLHALGGVGTTGLITRYWFGYLGGFSAEPPNDKSGWDPWEKAEWYRKEIRKAGGDIWYGVLGSGAFVENGVLRGVVVATPAGRGVVLAKVVVDSTGNSDVAASAGAQTTSTGADELAVQGTGLPPMKLGASYANTDFTIVDETDMTDVWQVLVYAKSKYASSFDMGQLMDTRERRRIVGDFTLTLPDEMNLRTYPDTICIADSNFDTHGYTIDPYLLMEHPRKKMFKVDIPYRCLLPRGLDQILVTGLGISAHRDAMPIIRTQGDIQNQGYSAGVIAATCALKNVTTRTVDLPAVQRELNKKGQIPDHCLTDHDSYPLSPERIAEAVRTLPNGQGLAVIVTHPRESLPLLRDAYGKAVTSEDRLAYAEALAILGDNTGLDALIEAVDGASWDKGWNYVGMGQFGPALSRLDSLIIAMGRTHDKRALPAILRKAGQLDATKEFSHHRAIALACESIGDPAAAAPLAELLKKPGMSGFVESDVETARRLSGASSVDVTTRQTAIRELSLARALYHCGDADGLGRKILEQYANDLRGHFARHAQAVLAETRPSN